jgi:hypothetical protein
MIPTNKPSAAAGTNPIGSPIEYRLGMITTGSTKSPVLRSSANTIAGIIAIAPTAKLTTPLPRYVMITLMEKAAYIAPVPTPSRA